MKYRTKITYDSRRTLLRRMLPLFIVIIFSQVQAQNTITPAPYQIIYSGDSFRINPHTTIQLQGSGLQATADFFNAYLEKYYGFKLPVTEGGSKTDHVIILNYDKIMHPIAGAYNLVSNKYQVYIGGDNSAGVFYGVQSLIQLLPVVSSGTGQLSIPGVKINDRPRFEYRGAHLDVARHFQPVSYVKKFIDYLAYHKLNKFHWHLTDDQGWRIEIKKYPLLTTTGSCRAQTLVGRYGSDRYDSTEHCGFYTQEDIRDVVRYAADRHITVIPEIDVPGHTTAALASYPFLGCSKGPYRVSETWGVHHEVLCAGNDSTYRFLEDVFDEVLAVFPSEYIHIGGDEVPKDRWQKCSVCQQRIKSAGLKNENDLQGYFFKRVSRYLTDKGRKVIGWDEIVESGLPAGATVMNWRGSSFARKAIAQGSAVIYTPEDPLYLNFRQSKNEDSLTQGGYNPVEHVFGYRPWVPENNPEMVKGIQANMWTEYINNIPKLEYMLFPRLSAMAEIAWSDTNVLNWKDFEARLPLLMDRYKLWQANYSRAYYGLEHEVIPANDGIAWKISSRSAGKIIYVKSKEKSATTEYNTPVLIDASGKWGAALTDSSNKIISPWSWRDFSINKATGKKVTLSYPPNKMYGGSGGFSLVDGIQNSLGMERSSEFLGFIGNDFEMVLDLGRVEEIDTIRLHAFQQPESWIYKPRAVKFYYSLDGQHYKRVDNELIFRGKKHLQYIYGQQFKARFIKIYAEKHGKIAEGLPGAGRNSWLFFHEIEVI